LNSLDERREKQETAMNVLKKLPFIAVVLAAFSSGGSEGGN
jgi:hypothetical protein